MQGYKNVGIAVVCIAEVIDDVSRVMFMACVEKNTHRVWSSSPDFTAKQPIEEAKEFIDGIYEKNGIEL